jgi:threonine/homoserine/homoserine lactone efflux protein
MEKIAFNLPGTYSIEPVAGMPTGGLNTLKNVITNGLTWAFVLITLASLAFLIWGGIEWITSGGDKGKVDAARKKITYAIIGLLVALSSFLIINVLGWFLGIGQIV